MRVAFKLRKRSRAGYLTLALSRTWSVNRPAVAEATDATSQSLHRKRVKTRVTAERSQGVALSKYISEFFWLQFRVALW